jgi:hypothetical protein
LTDFDGSSNDFWHAHVLSISAAAHGRFPKCEQNVASSRLIPVITLTAWSRHFLWLREAEERTFEGELETIPSLVTAGKLWRAG